MKKRSKKILRRAACAMLSAFIVTSFLSGCGSGNESNKADEKIRIKVQYMCGRMNLDLESVLEEKFPHVDIVTDELVGDPNYIIAKEMEHNIEPDIYLYEGLYQMDDKVIADKFYSVSGGIYRQFLSFGSVGMCQ